MGEQLRERGTPPEMEVCAGTGGAGCAGGCRPPQGCSLLGGLLCPRGGSAPLPAGGSSLCATPRVKPGLFRCGGFGAVCRSVSSGSIGQRRSLEWQRAPSPCPAPQRGGGSQHQTQTLLGDSGRAVRHRAVQGPRAQPGTRRVRAILLPPPPATGQRRANHPFAPLII